MPNPFHIKIEKCIDTIQSSEVIKTVQSTIDLSREMGKNNNLYENITRNLQKLEEKIREYAISNDTISTEVTSNLFDLRSRFELYQNKLVNWLKAIILVSAHKDTLKESPARKAQLIFDYSTDVQKQMQRILHQSRPNISRRSRRRESSENSLSSQNRSRSRSRNARYAHSNASLINMMQDYIAQQGTYAVRIEEFKRYYDSKVQSSLSLRTTIEMIEMLKRENKNLNNKIIYVDGIIYSLFRVVKDKFLNINLLKLQKYYKASNIIEAIQRLKVEQHLSFLSPQFLVAQLPELDSSNDNRQELMRILLAMVEPGIELKKRIVERRKEMEIMTNAAAIDLCWNKPKHEIEQSLSEVTKNQIDYFRTFKFGTRLKQQLKEMLSCGDIKRCLKKILFEAKYHKECKNLCSKEKEQKIDYLLQLMILLKIIKA